MWFQGLLLFCLDNHLNLKAWNDPPNDSQEQVRDSHEQPCR